MELKWVKHPWYHKTKKRFNRTFMELKCNYLYY